MPKEPHAPRRAIVYCVVPPDLAERLHGPLRRHFAAERDIEVVVEQRQGERRTSPDRRTGDGGAKPDRRRVQAVAGRRMGERRELVAIVDALSLPRQARRFAERLTFLERIEQPTLQAEDINSQRLVTAFQSGRQEAYAELYMRYFDRVYNYIRVVVRDDHEAEEGTQQVFLNALTALPRYKPGREPFRAWLFIIARNQAITMLRRQGRLQTTDPAVLDRRRESAGAGTGDITALEWITDRELLMLIERLPLPQRQVLLLRYMLDLSHREIAAVLDRSSDDVRMQLHRAQRFLRERLDALGRRTEHHRPQRMLRRPAHAYLLRRRRFALMR